MALRILVAWAALRCAAPQTAPGNATDGGAEAPAAAAAPPPPRNASLGGALGGAAGAYVNNYNGGNPLNIRAAATRSDNYFLILGDWGKADAPGECQLAVAEKMKAYVAEQSAAGKTLLFVAAAGDNFYWSGVLPHSWKISWEDVYGTNDEGSPLYGVPWLAALGNHDYGNNDPFAFCPHMQGELALAAVGGQPYGSNQLNADKNPGRPASTRKYWLPDYNYHYEIPGADLEVIVIDTNAEDLEELGGNAAGRTKAFGKCGGGAQAAGFLGRVAKAGLALLAERAAKGHVKTVLILQHYPGKCHKEVFLAALPAGRKVSVLCAYGHVHTQACQGVDANGNCNMVLTGGGGGCCESHLVAGSAGFTAVALDDEGGFVTKVGTPDVTLPAGGCRWRRRLQLA